MEQIIAWISLIAIFAIPLASMIPRMLRKRIKNKEKSSAVSQQTISEKRQSKTNPEYSREEAQMEFSKFQQKNILVLGELVRGSKTFESIQKNTGLDNKELDSILEDLEKDDMLKVHQKKGLTGMKIQLYPTDKGLKEYHS